VKGKFALIPPSVRRELRRRRELDPETLDTFAFHPSALTRLLADQIPRYPYFWLINRRLRLVDRLALQLHVELSYRAAMDGVDTTLPPWLKEVLPRDSAGCPGRVRAFVAMPLAPAPDEREAFKRDFCLWLLCSEEAVAKIVGQLVEDTSLSLEQQYLHADHEELDVLAGWIARGKAIVEEIKRASSELPLSKRAQIEALAERIETSTLGLQKETAAMAMRAGLRRHIIVGPPSR
jgi:hypothetical protein